MGYCGNDCGSAFGRKLYAIQDLGGGIGQGYIENNFYGDIGVSGYLDPVKMTDKIDTFSARRFL